MTDFVDPEPRSASMTGSDRPLTDDQIGRWRSNGFVFLDGLFDDRLIADLVEAATARYPAPGTSEAENISNFGSGAAPATVAPLVFPAPVETFNQLTLDPGLLSAVGQLLQLPVSELRLTQSDLWAKYGRATTRGGRFDNQDQRIHVDYPNHTLVHPAPWDRPEAVEIIVYLSDHARCGGSTAVVPRQGPDDPAYRWPIVDSPGIADLDWINDRPRAEAYIATARPELAAWRQNLYDREVQTRFRLGSVLLYRHDTWHRGTPLIPGTMRLAHNLTFRRADCEWISTLHPGWSWAMYRQDKLMERMIAALSVDQRSVLGFPKPGSPYWSAETVAAVDARYGPFGMDMEPYRAALS